ncbi:hypothetical protein ACP70R_018748 [Stipagrostis hirtigluma subsp. patula]
MAVVDLVQPQPPPASAPTRPTPTPPPLPLGHHRSTVGCSHRGRGGASGGWAPWCLLCAAPEDGDLALPLPAQPLDLLSSGTVRLASPAQAKRGLPICGLKRRRRRRRSGSGRCSAGWPGGCG